MLSFIGKMCHQAGDEAAKVCLVLKGCLELLTVNRVRAHVDIRAYISGLDDLRLAYGVLVNRLTLNGLMSRVCDRFAVCEVDLADDTAPAVSRHLQSFEFFVIRTDSNDRALQDLGDGVERVFVTALQCRLRDRNEARQVSRLDRYLTGCFLVDRIDQRIRLLLRHSVYRHLLFSFRVFRRIDQRSQDVLCFQLPALFTFSFCDVFLIDRSL